MKLNQLYHMDCMEGMKAFPDNYFDLAIVDPPYGSSIMAKNKNQKHKTTDTNYRNKSIPSSEYFRELERVSKHSIIWGAQYMMEHLTPGGSFIVWDKGAEPDKHNMSSCDVAYYTKRVRVERLRANWCGAVKCEREPTIHIHQKPKMLYQWLLRKFADPSFKIIDTHAGSCSSVCAMIDFGCDWIAFEKDADYYKSALDRITQHESQQNLFRPDKSNGEQLTLS